MELFHPLTQDGRVSWRHISTYLALLQCRERYIRTYFHAAVPTSAGMDASASVPEHPIPLRPPPQPVPPTPTARPGPFYIHRDEIMRLAKIQGRNTYYSTMAELDAWGYIEYWPSRRSKGATKVFLPML